MKKRFGCWSFIAVGMALLISACAPAAAPAPSAPAAPAQPKAPAPAPAPVAAPQAASGVPGQPKYGGTLTFVSSRQGPHLDPLGAQSSQLGKAVSLIYDKLVRYDLGAGGYTDSVLMGELAEKWDFASDGKSLTVQLRKGIKFQNLPPLNGRELTAQDVKFAIERAAFDPSSPFQVRYTSLKEAQVLDKYTVKFVLDKPWVMFLGVLAGEPSWIVPPEIDKLSGSYKANAIGSGPFIIDKTVEGVGHFYHKNPDYFDAKNVYVDKYEFLIIPDLASRVAAFRTGQTFYLEDTFTKSQLDNLLKTNPDINYVKRPGGGHWGIWFKYQGAKPKPPFDDIRVRMAVSKAINRDAIIKTVQEGDGSYAGPVPPVLGDWALSDQDVRKHPSMVYDPDAAKKLLAEAGLTNGFSFKGLYWTTGSSPTYKLTNELIINDLSKVGITVKTVPEEYASWIADCYGGNFEDACLVVFGIFSVWDYTMGPYYTGAWRNGSNMSIPEVDKALIDAQATLNDQERKAKLLSFQRNVLDNVLGVTLPLANSFSVSQKWAKNFRDAARPYDIVWHANIWLDR